MNYICKIASPFGMLTVSSSGASVTGLWIEGQKYYAESLTGGAIEKDLPIFESVKEWLDCYFKGQEPAFTPPLAPEGSDFRQSVWKILRHIPYGEVTTYGEIARQLERQSPGKKVSAQAVGGAVGHNPISIMIPCHRVVGTNGSLTGYAGGISAKIKLLQLENVRLKMNEGKDAGKIAQKF